MLYRELLPHSAYTNDEAEKAIAQAEKIIEFVKTEIEDLKEKDRTKDKEEKESKKDDWKSRHFE